ncbi:MAG: rRNA maturation RNAse YbeY, partial [Pirellulales bacterium]|nr:rRNA maturation RNAse YbeY [Pirellulales bacterium]
MKTLKHPFLAAMDALEITDSEISLAIVSDKAIAVLHEKWLGISGPTDVLSLNLSSTKNALPYGHGKKHKTHGEIIYSAEADSR